MDQSAWVMAPLVLVAVFVTSAVAKLRDRQSTSSAIALLRLPAVATRSWVPVALPIGELALSGAMVTPWSWLVRLASVVCLALCILYWIVIGRAMRFDPRPTCGCFGRIGDQRVGGRTLLRNSMFVALAVAFVGWAARGRTVPAAVADFQAGEWAWVCASLLTVLVTWFVVGRPAEVSGSKAVAPKRWDPAAEDDEADYIRTPIPHVTLLSPDKEPMTLHEMASARAQLLVFVRCGCGSTYEGIARMPEWQATLPALDVRMVSTVKLPDPTPELPTGEAWRDHGGMAYTALNMGGSPSAVLLGADGLLAGGPVNGMAEIEQFVADIAEALAEAGAEAPADSTADASV